MKSDPATNHNHKDLQKNKQTSVSEKKTTTINVIDYGGYPQPQPPPPL